MRPDTQINQLSIKALWMIDLQEDIENGTPSSLQAALAMLTLAKDAFLWNSSFLRSVDWQSFRPT